MAVRAPRPSLDVLAANIRAVEPPAVIVRLPSEVIVASSRSADRLLGPPRQLLGRTFGECAQGLSREPVELIASGLITGYMTDRLLAQTGARARFWVHGLDVVPPIELALALLVLPTTHAARLTPARDVDRLLPVIGTTTESFAIDGLSVDADAEVLGHRPAELIGQSLLSLIDPTDMAHVMVVFEHMSPTTGAVALQTRMVCGDQSILSGQLVLVPHGGGGGHTFAFIAAESGTTAGATAVVGVLQRLGDHISYHDGAAVPAASESQRASARADAWREVPGFVRLSRREREIVTRLIDGDRVGTIGTGLFLTASTIRNHLSAAYSKLGVSSQQELIDLLRGGGGTDLAERSRPR